MDLDPSPNPRYANRRSGNNLFLGLVLIFIGVLFFLQQIGMFTLHNWWALFILIPAFGSFSTAWYAYQRNFRINEGVRAGLGGGLITLTIALIFLLNLHWEIWWPLMVIVPGLATFMNGFTLPGSRELGKPLITHLYRPWTGWIGIGMIYLGSGFLANNLNLINMQALAINWWAISILIPALGGVITAVRLASSGGMWSWAGIGNLVTTAVFVIVGSVALLGISWNLLGPIIMIAIGLVFLMGTLKKRT